MSTVHQLFRWHVKVVSSQYSVLDLADLNYFDTYCSEFFFGNFLKFGKTSNSRDKGTT